MLLFMALVLVVGINFIFLTVRQCQKLYVMACLNAEYLIQALSIHLLEYIGITDEIIPEVNFSAGKIITHTKTS